MVPTGRRVGRQVQDIGQHVVPIESDGSEVEHARDEDHAVEEHAVTSLKLVGKPGRAGRSIALTGDELGRPPSFVPRRPESDELRDRLTVAFEPMEVVVVDPLGGATVTGGDGIDEDEIAPIEQRRLVVDEPPGRRQEITRIPHLDASRPPGAQMQPDRTRPRPPVETEGHRPRGGIQTLNFRVLLIRETFVAHEENASHDIAVGLLEERQRAGGRAIADRLITLHDLMDGDRVLVGKQHRRRGSLAAVRIACDVRRTVRGDGDRENPEYRSVDHRSMLAPGGRPAELDAP